jgi:hypothetical protein
MSYGSGFEVKGLGLGVLRRRVKGLGYRGWSLEVFALSVYCLGFKRSGFRVWGLMHGVLGLGSVIGEKWRESLWRLGLV